MGVKIDPIAFLSVAAGANAISGIAGKRSPDWIKILAVAATGVALISNMRNVIERQQLIDAGVVDAPGSVVDDAKVVWNHFTGQPGVSWY